MTDDDAKDCIVKFPTSWLDIGSQEEHGVRSQGPRDVVLEPRKAQRLKVQ